MLYADYEIGFAIIEFIGEWNDAIENDIMTLKRELIDKMLVDGISKFILIGENVLNFHSSDECYYEEWCEDVEEKGGGLSCWDCPINQPMISKRTGIHRFVELLDLNDWRPFTPINLFNKVDNLIIKRLGE